MLYKEWIIVRTKFWVSLFIYGVVGLLFSVLAYPFRDSINPHSLFYDWLWTCCGITVLTGILAGVDLVSEEIDKNTLSFLLTRPISREHIYRTKLGINAAAIAATFILSSLFVLWVDQLGSHPINLTTGLIGVIAVVLEALTMTCLSGLISIFARNTVSSMVIALATVTAGFFLLIVATNFLQVVATDLLQIYPLRLEGPGGYGLVIIIMALVGAVLYLAGLTAFRRREF
ncbi:MAG TPA: ABC transporter permease subunit [Chloroflexia bacterium]|nr:ABC transporter permease subunit [Chloroflexia bacterium]